MIYTEILQYKITTDFVLLHFAQLPQPVHHPALAMYLHFTPVTLWIIHNHLEQRRVNVKRFRRLLVLAVVVEYLHALIATLLSPVVAGCILALGGEHFHLAAVVA